MSRIQAVRSADYTRRYQFPEAAAANMQLSTFDASITIAADENAAPLLTVFGATANGSSCLVNSPLISILLRQADLALLPAGTPWVGYYRVNLISQVGVVTQIDADIFELGGAA